MILNNNRPSRVLVSAEGCALPPRMAETRYGIKPDIIFYREDGWSIGAPADLERYAYEMWRQSWRFFQRNGQPIKPIKQYQPKQKE